MRSAVALPFELEEPRTPSRHEAVLRGDEERGQEDQRRDGDEFQKKRHAPISGACVLSGSSKPAIVAQYRYPDGGSPSRTYVRYADDVSAEYREEPCRSALNRVRGMMFEWSLNPYMGCVHRCTFCYVRAFERRVGRPSHHCPRATSPPQGEGAGVLQPQQAPAPRHPAPRLHRV